MEEKEKVGVKKTSVGIWFWLFGGFLGLIAGCLLYPIGTEERETFIEGCKIGFWIIVGCIVFSLLCLPIVAAIF